MLEDKHLLLKEIELEDTANIVKWRNTLFVREKFVFQETLTTEIHEQWMKNMVNTGKVKQFIIYVKDAEVPIGSVYLRDIDMDNRIAEYGIFIGEEKYLNQGYGTRAGKLVLEYAFSKLKLDRVILRVLKNNIVAIKSYEKLGFRIKNIMQDEIKEQAQCFDLLFMEIIHSTKKI